MKTPIVEVKEEAGYTQAMEGLALSYNKDVADMPAVALKLYRKDGGHNKFLESIQVWMLVTLPRHLWQQFDTYRIGVTKQSESTMHTIARRPLMQDDFDVPVLSLYLEHLNDLIAQREFIAVKNALPESFLQTRMVNINYKALRHIMRQRHNHKMPHWRQFCFEVVEQLEYKEFFGDILEKLGVMG